MERIYSKVQEGLLLHCVNRLEAIDGRTNLCDTDQFLQCSSLKLPKGTTFRPHKHIMKERFEPHYIPQESWVVIEGSVKCFFFDLDDSLIETVIIRKGDASFTFRGGHNYEILEEGTIVYEYKTGPYLGIENDKTHIDG